LYKLHVSAFSGKQADSAQSGKISAISKRKMDNKTSTILLRGGTLLLHDENNRVVPRKSDLLIQADRITRIDDEIRPPIGTKIIDCEGALVSPGFIDTHRHLWQSQQKGLHCDQILLDYYHSGTIQ
jgi:cytosine/adenosine deaminase-related metal-dependent hydrolase